MVGRKLNETREAWLPGKGDAPTRQLPYRGNYNC